MVSTIEDELYILKNYLKSILNSSKKQENSKGKFIFVRILLSIAVDMTI